MYTSKTLTLTLTFHVRPFMVVVDRRHNCNIYNTRVGFVHTRNLGKVSTQKEHVVKFTIRPYIFNIHTLLDTYHTQTYTFHNLFHNTSPFSGRSLWRVCVSCACGALRGWCRHDDVAKIRPNSARVSPSYSVWYFKNNMRHCARYIWPDHLMCVCGSPDRLCSWYTYTHGQDRSGRAKDPHFSCHLIVRRRAI